MFAWDSKRTMRLILVDCPTIELSQFIRTLDNKLSFNKHNVDKESYSLTHAMQKSCDPNWWLTISTKVQDMQMDLYHSVSVWIRAALNNGNANSLERMQAMVHRIMTGAMSSTPFRALEPITITLSKGTALRESIVCKGAGTGPLNPLHLLKVQSVLTPTPTRHPQPPNTHHTLNIDCNSTW